MCGIVGAVAQRDIAEILLMGLQSLEYRGYDSAGIATIDNDGELRRIRRVGKVKELVDAVAQEGMAGGVGIAHTRWATHGEPNEQNAHPHVSTSRIAVVHNGIIENHAQLRIQLEADGYVFTSDTDTEVIAHMVDKELKSSSTLFEAVQKVVRQLEGAYGTVILDKTQPERLIVARSGSPLVIGYGVGEHFIASDQLALLPVTRKFAYLEEGDVAEITRTSVSIVDDEGNSVKRKIEESNLTNDAGDKGNYRHYMQKEIYEQPVAIQRTLEGRIANGLVLDTAFGENAGELLAKVRHVQIIACGTSYHAGMTARYWLEAFGGVSCNVEIASEYRYRESYVHENSLLVTISQSGETADTLAALRLAKEQGYMTSLTLCNSPGSSMVRESDMSYLMKAGAEIGVASTKAFTVQLTGLLMLAGAIGQHNGLAKEKSAHWLKTLLISITVCFWVVAISTPLQWKAR